MEGDESEDKDMPELISQLKADLAQVEKAGASLQYAVIKCLEYFVIAHPPSRAAQVDHFEEYLRDYHEAFCYRRFIRCLAKHMTFNGECQTLLADAIAALEESERKVALHAAFVPAEKRIRRLQETRQTQPDVHKVDFVLVDGSSASIQTYPWPKPEGH